MAEEKQPKQRLTDQPKQDTKKTKKKGAHTIPVQMSWMALFVDARCMQSVERVCTRHMKNRLMRDHA